MFNAAADLKFFLIDAFPRAMRARGAALRAQGRVEIQEAENGFVLARVKGTWLYQVALEWLPHGLPGDVDMDCSCPAFEQFGPCKHLWAVLLELEESGPTKPGKSTARAERDPFGLSRIRALRRAPDETWQDPWVAVAGDERQLRYVIDVPASSRDAALILEIRTAKRLKSGKWGGIRRINPFHHGARPPTDPLDRRLLAAFAGARPDWGLSYSALSPLGPRLALAGPLALALIGDLCATGRLYWERGSEGGGPLAWDDGPPWILRAAVERDGEQSELGAWLQRGDERMPLDEPLGLFECGLLLAHAGLARFDGRGSFDLAVELRKHGPLRVPRAAEDELVAALVALPGRALESAPELPPVESTTPVPHLFVEGGGDRGHQSVLGCSIDFDYGGTRVGPEDPREVIAGADGARNFRRDAQAEQGAIRRFLELGGRRAAEQAWHDQPGAVLARQLPGLVQGLLAEGWTVEAQGVQWRRPGAVSISVASGLDWFDLEGGIQYGDQVAALPELLAAARAGRQFVTLGDGSIGMLPERWLESWGVLGFGERQGDAVRFQNNQAWLLDSLLAERGELVTDAGFEQLRRRLAGFERVEPASEPVGFVGELRPYQKEGLGWLRFLASYGLGGCLADDMGLGKTVQVLAHLESRRAEGGTEPRRPSLVVAPRSLVFNWIDEAARFTPRLTTLDYTGSDRKTLRSALAATDLVLTTYGTLRRDAAFLSSIDFDCVVLDEAQAIKNAASQSAKAARLLRGRQRLALSGTPIENHLGELWSLFEFLNPGMLGRSKAFSDLVERGQVEGQGLEPGQLARALRPFFLRRRKEQVLSDLPPKTEQVVHCVLSPKERRRYDELREHFRRSLLAREEEIGLGRMKIQVLEALLRLRQAACHPALLDPARKAESSAKLEALLPRLEEVAAEGHKALVFSQFTRLLALVRDRLDQAGIVYEYLDGRTRDRKAPVERFQTDPACPLFLISIKAGGHGLNLTAADYIFLLDPWWNPAVESQAIDRAHRIGRTRPVVAYRLIAENTIEERVQELQERKRALAAALFDQGPGGLRGLTRDELERLLAE